MNEDHAESVLAYAHHFANLPNATAARMTAVLPQGFELEIEDGGGKKSVVVTFPAPLESAGQVRKRAVEMHHQAFSNLGFGYRVRSGYYSRLAKMAAKHVGSERAWLVGTVAAVGCIALALRNRWK